MADDINIFISAKNLNVLKITGEKILTNLHRWFSVNKLTMNVDKSCFSIFTSREKDPEIFTELAFRNHTIKKVQSAKYLGIILDDKLNWNEHVHSVRNNAVKYLNCLKYVKYHIPSHCAKILYYSFIYPRISYGIESFGKTSVSNIHKHPQTTSLA